MKYDFLIVGSGLAGSIVAERIASQLDKKVLIVEKRNHIGGNCYDYYDDKGILVHKYGPHIFHTNNKKVWDYLSQFTSWHFYQHHVLAEVEGKKVPVPFNLNSLYQLFSQKYSEKLENLLLEKYGYGLKIPILKMRENSQEDIKFLADYIYKNIFYGYNIKQWGLKPEELDPTVSGRVPVFISRDNRYFQDTYQGIPANGYTSMFNNLLNHKNIHILLNADYKAVISSVKFNKLIYTGAIDYYFDYIHGELPYRSLLFDFKNYDIEKYQETAQVNYPNSHDFTRITEFKHFLSQKTDITTVAIEYSIPHKPGITEPYYPIPRKENEEIFSKYNAEAKKLKNTFFVGRLADYKYYNMDQIAGVALMFFDKHLTGK